MPRFFVAIDIPERIKEDVTTTYCALPGARWTDDEQLHLTLRFIGEVAGDDSDDITKALRSVTGPSFPLSLKGVGFFPPRGDPRILWVGIAPSEELLRLQARIERACTSAGIEPDKRKFHPHITVARLNDTPPRKVADYIAQNSLLATETFAVSSFHLYSSVLRKEGAVHTKELSFPLDQTGSPADAQ